MNSEELDSQLSAMFDDELPEPECELLARRLARDEGLKARWGRYAAIGACIRMEGGVRLHGDLAGRVSRAIAAEPALLAGNRAAGAKGLVGPAVSRWWQPVAGGAVVAASVAAAAILWLRASSPGAPLPGAPIVAQTGAAQPTIATGRVLGAALSGSGSARSASETSSSGDSDSYVVPPAGNGPTLAPPTELANFVVAHSEFSMPLLRRSALSALVAGETRADDADQAGVATGAATPAGAADATSRTVNAHPVHAP